MIPVHDISYRSNWYLPQIDLYHSFNIFSLFLFGDEFVIINNTILSIIIVRLTNYMKIELKF